jgi:hypothetical protein
VDGKAQGDKHPAHKKKKGNMTERPRVSPHTHKEAQRRRPKPESFSFLSVPCEGQFHSRCESSRRSTHVVRVPVDCLTGYLIEQHKLITTPATTDMSLQLQSTTRPLTSLSTWIYRSRRPETDDIPLRPPRSSCSRSSSMRSMILFPASSSSV